MDLSAVLRHHFHHQESDSQTLETLIASSKPQQHDPKKPRPPENEPQKCPRCESTNTKFCYYNNYSLSQPRYFCKSCRRYWTKGGTLRNVPVGGGCRRHKRPSSSPSFSATATSFLKRPHTHDLGGHGLGFDSPHLNLDAFPPHPNHHNGGFLLNSIQQPSLAYGAPNAEMGVLPFEGAMKEECFESRGLWGLYPWQHQMITSTNNHYNVGDNHHGLISSMGLGGISSANDLEAIRGIMGNSAWQANLLPSPALI